MFNFLKNLLTPIPPTQENEKKHDLRDTNQIEPSSETPSLSPMQIAINRAIAEAKIERKGQDRPQDQIFFEHLEKHRATDPLIGPKMGKKEIWILLTEALAKHDSKGIHVESLFCILGSLAGYACQASLFARAVADQSMGALAGQLHFVTYGRAPEETNYFMGDPLNKPLAESPHSIWSLAAGQAQFLGCTNLPDLNEIFVHVMSTLGRASFGLPRFPGHSASETPFNYVKDFWPAFLPTVKAFCKTPEEWPILFGMAIQEAMELAKDAINPRDALVIVMESAIPMSKVTF